MILETLPIPGGYVEIHTTQASAVDEGVAVLEGLDAHEGDAAPRSVTVEAYPRPGHPAAWRLIVQATILAASR